jgi:para-nitrobenzyl esterase
MSKHISGAYVAFARTGNPNHPGLPHWPAHTRDGATMVFDNVSKVRYGLEAEGLRLIAKS